MKKYISASFILLLVMLFLTACTKEKKESNVLSTSMETESESETELEFQTESESETETESDTSTKAETKEISRSNEEKPDFGPLSDDLYSFQIEINGEVYQFPMTYSQFTSYGWEYKEDDNTTMDSLYYSSTEQFTLNGMQCYAHIINLDVNSLPIKDCVIGGISLEDYDLKKANTSDDISIVMPGGITFGVSSADDVRAAYGTPSHENQLDNGAETISYKLDYNQEIKFSISAETKVISKISIENYKEPEGFTAGEINTEVPEIVGKYQTPASMSNDFADWIVEFDSKLYQLPAPVSDFEADGWVIQEDRTEMTINGRGSGWVTMMKDNQILRVIAQNYSENSTAVNNCFICDVISDQIDSKISLTVAGGITIGTTEADLKAAIAGMETKEEEGNSYRSYKVMPTGKLTDSYEFTVSSETSLVTKIKVSYTPKYADYTSK